MLYAVRSRLSGRALNVPRYDLICVGGGPANLALAEELKKRRREASILILELGRDIGSRHCPLASHSLCPPCKLCHAVHGIAGAGAYSDGKVSFWPAGSGLLHMAGKLSSVLALDDKLRTYYEKLRRDGGTATSCTQSSELARSLCSRNLELKGYDVIHAGSEAIQEFYQEKQRMLQESGVIIQSQSRVTDVAPCEMGGHSVSWTHRGELRVARASILSLGTGKASGRWLRGILDRLGIERQFTEIEHGVRLEMPHTVTERLAACHRDAKIKIAASDGSEVRTFCLCQRGFVLAAYYDDMTTVSGYSLRDRRSENTNLALLNRISMPAGINPYIEFLPSIQAQNRRARGGATVQRLCDFIAGAETTEQDLTANPVRPTLTSAVPGKVELHLDERIRRNLVNAIRQIDQVCPGFASPYNLVYGPVLEKCWDKVKLTSMKTTAPGVYVVGDAAGHARGLVQAAATGLLVAQSIVEEWTEVTHE
ncbi:FAD-dependent protein [Sorangium sp. So ce375]|uniref:FAD-dependent protein n=1 Tax=Sorangium sp. So ce375 TaxID=3133306 RepID=UPI003F5C362E